MAGEARVAGLAGLTVVVATAAKAGVAGEARVAGDAGEAHLMRRSLQHRQPATEVDEAQAAGYGTGWAGCGTAWAHHEGHANGRSMMPMGGA